MAALTTTTTTNAKARFISMVRKAHELGQAYLITHRGEDSAVLLGSEEYEGLLETIAILKNNKIVASITASLKDLKEGNISSFQEVIGRKQNK
ncbi:MAG: type II toxin-antitoxin system Phd/YefM family antitoxin [Candidatus Omnitrophica bacterium]|nr:type II toxin-antitoxin system Phd/YefM family antitoxin [Candidatus Omnitrophota bacterium]